MTVPLEYLDRTFSICGYHLFYNSLMFNSIFLSLSRGSFLCLVHLHSNFQLIPLGNLCDIGRNSWFFNYSKSTTQFLPRLGVGLSFISLLSITQSISNHQKTLLWTSYKQIFKLFLEAVLPVGLTEVRLCFMHKSLIIPWTLNRFSPNWYWYLLLDPQYMYQISTRLKYAYTSYSDFCKVCKKNGKRTQGVPWFLRGSFI